jgi:hypothetical protein
MCALQGLVVSVLEHLEDVLGQRLFDFSMAWDRLADTRSRVLIPIVAFFFGPSSYIFHWVFSLQIFLIAP